MNSPEQPKSRGNRFSASVRRTLGHLGLSRMAQARGEQVLPPFPVLTDKGMESQQSAGVVARNVQNPYPAIGAERQTAFPHQEAALVPESEGATVETGAQEVPITMKNGVIGYHPEGPVQQPEGPTMQGGVLDYHRQASPPTTHHSVLPPGGVIQ